MKTERRHELQTNDLADWLGQKIQAVKPYSKAISLVIVGAVALLLLWAWSNRRAAQLEQQAWDSYFAVTSPGYLQERLQRRQTELQERYNDDQRQLTPEEQREAQREVHAELKKLADNYRGTAAGAWAALRYADTQQAEGAESLFQQQSEVEARPFFNEAVEYYTLARDQAEEALLRSRATFGLARALESRRATSQRDSEQDDLKLAEAEYERLEGSIYEQIAQRRQRNLEEGDFYQWFGERIASQPPAGTGSPTGFDPSSFGAGGPAEDLFDPANFGEEGAGESPAPTEEPDGDPAGNEPASGGR